jgi:superfamily II DNA or RNA helicase
LWTYVKKDEVENFLDNHTDLREFFNDLILHETPDAYFLPRLFSKNYPSKHLNVFEGKQDSYVPENININFKGELREKQHLLVNKVLDIYNKNGYINGIAKSYPGSGKTVMSVYLAAKLKVKTLIIVDKQELMKQWIKAFLEFSDLTIDDIGIIQQKHFGVDRPVIIAMGQTLQSHLKKGIKEAFASLDKSKIGLVIYDEVHTTSSAPVFSRISLLFRTRNILGLSATPFHTGLSEVLMKNTIGDVVYETKNYDLKPEYKLLFYKSNLDQKKIYLMSKMTDFIQRKSIYNKFIVDSPNYINLILDQTKKMRDLGHRIIIICFTKAQIMKLSETFDNHGLEHKRFFGDEHDIDHTENILIATYSFAGKG